ncbi:MAG TPA: DNA-directed RNA polymerase subunit alpha [bacterium]|nr:DNA-directed RNA polymerase subunit alpha [bacterium]
MVEKRFITKGIETKQEIEVLEENEVYGKYEFKPYERGFGQTIGHALRRVLLSSIIGAAVERIKIEGVNNEFATIPGVQEDVVDIILNIKKLSLSIEKGDKGIITIKEKGKNRVITAADIKTDGNVIVHDKSLYLFTLNDGDINIVMEVGLGRGYRDAAENILPNMPEGMIAIDSIYSPVKRVNYKVDNVRVGQDTAHDKLLLEIWTDGSISPRDALAHAAKILKDHLDRFINFDEESVQEDEEDYSPEEKKLKEILNTPITELELSVRASNCLKEIKIKTLGELALHLENDLLKTKNFGKKSLNEIKEKLGRYGLTLGMTNIDYLLNK